MSSRCCRGLVPHEVGRTAPSTTPTRDRGRGAIEQTRIGEASSCRRHGRCDRCATGWRRSSGVERAIECTHVDLGPNAGSGTLLFLNSSIAGCRSRGQHALPRGLARVPKSGNHADARYDDRAAHTRHSFDLNGTPRRLGRCRSQLGCDPSNSIRLCPLRGDCNRHGRN